MKQKRGFAAMDPKKQRKIASMGGKASHAMKRAHEFDSKEASAAGKKGGAEAQRRGTAHKFTSAEASAAGRKSRRSKKK